MTKTDPNVHAPASRCLAALVAGLAVLLTLGVSGTERAIAGPVETEPQQATVSIVITDSGMEVTPSTVQRSAVRFQIRTDTSVPYEVEIDGPGLDYDTRDIPPGGEHRATLELRPGRYKIEAEAEAGPDVEWTQYLTVRR